MGQAKKYIEDIKSIMNDAKAAYEIRNKQTAEMDRRLSKLYHKIESGENLNVVNGYSVYKELRDLLRQRRIVKEELISLDVLLNVNGGNILNTIIKAEKNTLKREKSFEDWSANWSESDFS